MPKSRPLHAAVEWFHIMEHVLLTRDTSHPEMSPLNDVALRNMWVILVTLDTSQLEKGPLDDRVNENMASMLVTLTR